MGVMGTGTNKAADMWFYGPLSIIVFLQEFKTTCDNKEIHEGPATWLTLYLMQKFGATALTAILLGKAI